MTQQIRRKRMRFRASHRGFKEMDLILGRFAEERLDSLTDAELDQFEAILDAADGPLYHWITGKEDVPAAFDTPVMAALRAYTPFQPEK